jgi:hypothetical protein
MWLPGWKGPVVSGSVGDGLVGGNKALAWSRGAQSNPAGTLAIHIYPIWCDCGQWMGAAARPVRQEFVLMKFKMAGAEVLSGRLKVRTMREWLWPGT